MRCNKVIQFSLLRVKITCFFLTYFIIRYPLLYYSLSLKKKWTAVGGHKKKFASSLSTSGTYLYVAFQISYVKLPHSADAPLYPYAWRINSEILLLSMLWISNFYTFWSSEYCSPLLIFYLAQNNQEPVLIREGQRKRLSSSYC